VLERVGTIGQGLRARLDVIGGIFSLAYASIKGYALERGRGRGIFRRTVATQIYFTAVEPFPFFALISLVFGVAAIVEAEHLLPKYGLHALVPSLVAAALVRELAPLVIGVILIGRTGTAISTELGYMRVNQEIDALLAAGINLEYFVVLPRIIGVTVACVCLTIAFAAIGVVFGFAVARALDPLRATFIFDELVHAITPEMIGYGVLKAVIFGVQISTINCYHGLSVQTSFTEIPRANGRGALQAFVACLGVNALISIYAVMRAHHQ
jgi:phospholipid/cholesterol/gamma-HCH transport system permease protein